MLLVRTMTPTRVSIVVVACAAAVAEVGRSVPQIAATSDDPKQAKKARGAGQKP